MVLRPTAQSTPCWNVCRYVRGCKVEGYNGVKNKAHETGNHLYPCRKRMPNHNWVPAPLANQRLRAHCTLHVMDELKLCSRNALNACSVSEKDEVHCLSSRAKYVQSKRLAFAMRRGVKPYAGHGTHQLLYRNLEKSREEHVTYDNRAWRQLTHYFMLECRGIFTCKGAVSEEEGIYFSMLAIRLGFAKTSLSFTQSEGKFRMCLLVGDVFGDSIIAQSCATHWECGSDHFFSRCIYLARKKFKRTRHYLSNHSYINRLSDL